MLSFFLNVSAIDKKYSHGYDMLPSSVNTKDKESAMSYFKNNIVYSVTKDNQTKLYVATVNDTIELQDVKEIQELSALGIYGTFGYDAKKNKIYFSKYEKSTHNYMLFESTEKNNKWSKPKRLKIKGMEGYRKPGSTLVNAGWLYRAPGISGFYNPTLAKDGKRIYFSSDFSSGKGGRDIWFIDLDADGKWAMPENVGDVVNTKGTEDFAFVSGDSLLYFASNTDSKGGLDLYVSKQENGKWAKATRLDSVYNSSTDDYNLIGNEKGLFFISGRNTAQGDDIFRPSKIKEKVVPPPPPVIVKRPFPWKLFYFDFDKDLFKPEFQKDLNELYLSMLEYIKDNDFVISGHTDTRGSVDYNNKLSLKRATRIRELLIEKGIPAEKMVVKAYGKSQPIKPDAQTEEEHAMNRRVEIDLVKKNNN
jgi:hypothetical protein